jgi:hypothetical protein
MPKRKASFSNPESNDDHDTKCASQLIDFNSISNILLFDEPSGKLQQATLGGKGKIDRGLSINSLTTCQCVKSTNLQEVSFRPQNSTQDTAVSHNLAAKSSLTMPSTEYRLSPPSYPLLRITHPEPASADPTVSSGILATANNVSPDNRIPQMTCRLFALMPLLHADII